MHYWWEWKLIKPPWKVLKFLKKLKIELPYDPETPPNVYPRETQSESQELSVLPCSLQRSNIWKQTSTDTAGKVRRARWTGRVALHCTHYQAWNRQLQASTGRSARCSVVTLRMARGNGREVQERGDTWTLMGDSRSCTAETNTTL